MLAGTIGSRPTGDAKRMPGRGRMSSISCGSSATKCGCRRPTPGGRSSAARRASPTSSASCRARAAKPSGCSRITTRAPTRPGPADDAFGVAVSLEAARVIAATADRQWTTYVLVTDAEEEGLMGAAALMSDAAVRDHLAAYINVESTGSSGPAMLFETGPGNPWLIRPWARRAAHPRGGSFATRDLQAASQRHRLLDPEAARDPRA